MGIKKLLTNITNAVSNRALDLRKLTNKEALLDEYLNLLSKLKLLSLEPKGNSPEALAKLAINLLLIRNARELRKLASSAEKDWIRQNADKATKVYKSGTKEFGGASNKLALQKAREAAINPYLDLYLSFSNLISEGSSLIKKMGKEDAKTIKNASKLLLENSKKLPKNVYNFIKTHPKAAKGVAASLGLAGLAAAGYNYEPINFYVHDLLKGVKNKAGLDSGSTTRTEKDMSDDFNNQIQELVALAIASNLPGLTPLIYQVYNKSHGREAKYADFSNPLKFFNPGQRVEYSDGGMSMSKSKNNNGYDVVLTDEAAWDPDAGTSYSPLSPRGLPVALGVTKKNLGDNIDKMRYLYNIPSEKVDSMRNVYNKYSLIIRLERQNKK